ncbi:hypothetical protein Mgra_00005637 [Meloidogyne graminicola]|uniref:Uncharacterized protein n=1 Tax=Meloidogyne graminicola TaxID=189291 RepID=A0A8S9ZP89_9BILA|nr:hypothetical protein Mgra_00005637 [Meloidogyne graminicola]
MIIRHNSIHSRPIRRPITPQTISIQISWSRPINRPIFPIMAKPITPSSVPTTPSTSRPITPKWIVIPVTMFLQIKLTRIYKTLTTQQPGVKNKKMSCIKSLFQTSMFYYKQIFKQILKLFSKH